MDGGGGWMKAENHDAPLASATGDKRAISGTTQTADDHQQYECLMALGKLLTVNAAKDRWRRRDVSVNLVGAWGEI